MKTFLAALSAFLFASAALAQSYPSPTFGNVTLQTPLNVSSGGTGTGSASGTALDNITGFSGTGFVTRTGAGAYSVLATPLPIADGGTSATSATGSGSVVLATSPTITSPTISAGAILNGPLTVTPTASSLTKAFNTSQSVSGASSANCTSTSLFVFPCANLFYVSSDGVDASSPNNVFNEWQYVANFGGSTLKGGRQLFNVIGTFTGASNAANTNPSYVSFVSEMATNSADGGTAPTIANGRGQFFASNPLVVADSGATNLFGIVGEEVNALCFGCTTALRFGLSSAAGGTTQAAVLNNDAAFHVGSIQSGGQWHQAFNLSNVNGVAPLDSTGCVICTDSTANTIGTGIDLSAYTITGNFLNGPNGFSVSGGGLITSANGLIVSGGGANVTGGLDVSGGLAVTTGTTTVSGSLVATGSVGGAGFTSLLSPYAPLASPALTGAPTAPTATAATNSTQIATTAFANTAVTGGGNSGSFTTLNASGNDALLYTNASGQSIANNTLVTVTTWTKTADRVNANFNASTGIFTAPAAGWYQISGQLTYSAAAGVVNAQYSAAILANGTVVAEGAGFQQSASTALVSVPFSATVPLSAGQTLQVQAFQTSGVARTLSASSPLTYVSINRLP